MKKKQFKITVEYPHETGLTIEYIEAYINEAIQYSRGSHHNEDPIHNVKFSVERIVS